MMRHALSVVALALVAAVVPACAASTDEAATTGDEQDVTGTAVASKKELFEGEQYYVRIKGWDGSKMSPASLRDEQHTANAELAIYKSNKASSLHCPDAETSDAKLVYKTKKFSLRTSGNLTNGTPKSSYKVSLEAKDDRLFDMKALNLKSMWNDASQMREALAWKLFQEAGVHAPRHTYARFCINDKYYGLYSMVEQVEKTFLKEHFGGNKDGNLYKAYWPPNDIGPADLSYRKAADGDDSGKQYFKRSSIDDRTYQLKTNDDSEDDAKFKTYDDIAALAKVVSGVNVPGDGATKFQSAAFQQAIEKVFDVKGFLRWASVNSLLGAWDNYWGTPANYYIYNAGTKAAPKDFMAKPYFVWIPWDYDNTFGSDFFGTKWQHVSVVDWEGSTKSYNGGRKTTSLPLVTNLLKNQAFLRYYLDSIEFMNDTYFTESWLTRTIGDERSGLRSRVQAAAYLESDTPSGGPHTGRQFTNDELFRHGFSHDELNRGSFHLEGILHYVRMRHDAVRGELAQLRTKHPKGSSGATFPVRAEPIP